ncbi:MAG: NADPH:quinone oxidoreductase [Rhodospirillales bacterium]|nr:NADPH:quinone oxidoreductase [Rhodospirillales bacterium]
MNNPIDILALSGSLRADSFNAKLLAAAQGVAPAGVEIEIYDYRDVPLYDGDVEVRDYPEAAQRLKDRLRKADALLIATPEYNYSVPGVLKNVLDWVSRPYGDSALAGKPLAIIGGGGGQGTNRAQDHLRQIAHGLDMRVVRRPEIFIANVWGKFDESGTLADPIANKLIAELLGNLADLARDAGAGNDIKAAA